MKTSQESHLQTEDRQNVPSIQSLSEDEKFVPRPALKIKSCSPYDAGSNLEFTNKSSKLYLPKSLANIRPGEHSLATPQKFHHQISLSRPQALKSPPKAQKKPREAPYRTDNIKKEIANTEDSLLLWKIWPGNNRFYLNGRLMTGPKTDKLPNIITWIFVIGINVLFFGVAFPFLVEELTALLPVLSTYLCLSTVILFLLTSFTDPGIIPRKCVWELSGEVPQPYSIALQRKDSSELSQMSDSQKKIVESSLKFCTICQIYRPPRTAHCKHCGNCVEVYGGHRFFVNNCIGKRNYRFFMGFIISLVLMAICHLACWIILLLFSLGVDIGPDPEPSFSNRTTDLVLFAIVGAPTAIFFAIKLGLFIAFLFTKAKKSCCNKSQNQEARNNTKTQAKSLTVDWYWSEPSRVKSRQLISRAQLQKYKGALGDGQEETIV